MAKNKKYIFGIRACIEAIKSGKEIEKLLFDKKNRGELFHELLSLANMVTIPFSYVPTEKLNRINSGNHQGVIAFVSPIEYSNIETIIPTIYENSETPLILMLDRLTDVRNFGAISRKADYAGVHAIIITAKGSASIGEDAIKTSAGALNYIPVCRVKSLSSTIEFLKECGLKIISATEKTEKPHTKADYNSPLCIVMGSEEDGVTNALLQLSDDLVKIPLTGNVESLNVSVAAGIVMFEALRSRENS